MKSASQLFFLAVFTFCSTTHAAYSRSPSRPRTPSSDVCAISPKAIVSDACASYSTLDGLNRELHPMLKDVTQNTDFFSYYRLNLFGKDCPFWEDANGMCGNIACAVNTLDNEEDIPAIWRAEELGKLEGPKAGHPGKRLQEERGPERPLQGMLGDDVGESCVVEYDDECDERDYCIPEDESAGAKGDYVSLVGNPERFTGYMGEGAKHVWDAIYRENCFSTESFPKPASYGRPQLLQRGPAANELKSVLKERERQQALEDHQKHNAGAPFIAGSGLANEDECLEKRVFYRVISGMHTSISTHICNEYLNQTTGEWGPNLQCYKERLHNHADRVSNLYFNYALVLRAITKLGPSLEGYTFCSGDPTQDLTTSSKVQALISRAGAVPQIFDESLMFVNGEGPHLKEDFRNRFRNVSRIMDCVGCDKCRLWGKLQTAGYGAALKVLFEFDNNAVDVPMLKRTELVALFNTLARISDSLAAISDFRSMVEEQETEEESQGHFHKMSDRVTKPRNVQPDKEYDPTSDDFSEFEQEEMRARRLALETQTFGDQLTLELTLVWKATKYVFWGWVTAPMKIWEILVLELYRLWQYYIGLPVSPRLWEIKHPRPDEL